MTWHDINKKKLRQSTDIHALRFLSCQLNPDAMDLKPSSIKNRLRWNEALQGTTEGFHLADSNLVSRGWFKTTVLHLPNLFSKIKQKTTESVVVAVIAEEAAFRQLHIHLVASAQLQDHNNSGTVLLVVCILIFWGSDQLVVKLQTGTSAQEVTRSTSITVDTDSKGIDTRVRSRKNASASVVVATQVKEDIFVDDDAVGV